MTARGFNSEASTTAVNEVLSDDAYKRGVELAFLQRVIRRMESESAGQLTAARAHKRIGLESEVIQELHDARSPIWKSLARQLEKTHPAQRDFGQFGKFRDSDR